MSTVVSCVVVQMVYGDVVVVSLFTVLALFHSCVGVQPVHGDDVVVFIFTGSLLSAAGVQPVHGVAPVQVPVRQQQEGQSAT